jgi:hypothetical protein
VLHNAFAQLLTDLIKLGEQEALHALFGGGQRQGGGSGGGGLLGSIMSLFGGGGRVDRCAFDLGGDHVDDVRHVDRDVVAWRVRNRHRIFQGRHRLGRRAWP